MLFAEVSTQGLKRLLEQRTRLVVESETPVHASHGVHEAALQLRLVAELSPYPAGPLVEYLSRGDALAERFSRI